MEDINISIPAPARGRTHTIFVSPHARNFNSRPREGANGEPVFAVKEADTFQFPPPRGGERRVAVFDVVGRVISIPAPARGRT